ncbi:hypothetical protein [Gordonia sp. OPL2]|uniref:hypothetical protein n=1 Tax=Gordonia sp. OPL2 TaxID=2486274 RepID=UPI0016553BAE|nr:hypothetical protein [Gordonia sp. OPL2]ROZ88009.1 hypothetical protein EEB19_22645 [Gordonia sp. OPL2]
MTTAEATSYPVTAYDGDSANGVANVVATLLMQNLSSYPHRVKTARAMSRPVTIYSTDTESACTVVFGADEAVVYNDVVGKPSVTVMASVEQILEVSQLKMKWGGLLPVGFFTKRGLGVLKEILTHRLVVKGLLSHTIASLRTISLLSVADS